MGVRGVVRNVVGGAFVLGALRLLSPSQDYLDALKNRDERFDSTKHTRVLEALESCFPSLKEEKNGLKHTLGITTYLVGISASFEAGRKLVDLILGGRDAPAERGR